MDEGGNTNILWGQITYSLIPNKDIQKFNKQLGA